MAVLVLGWIPATSWAGAWAKEQGHGVAILTYYFYTTSQQFTDGWGVEDFDFDGRFTKNEWNLYIEYGLTDRLTAFGNFFLDLVQYDNDFGSQTNFGLADQELGLRYQFSSKPAQSLQALIKIPGPYYVQTQPALGNGQVDLELDYFVGIPFQLWDRWGFVDAGVGFRLRTGAPADELRWYLTAGYKLSKHWEVFFLEASGIHGLGNDTPQLVGDNILLTTNFDLIKVGASVLWKPIDGWILQAGPYFQVAGRATGAGGGLKVALWREF